ncbi:hypothetical protein ACEE21_10230 [Clostridium baratii]|nr:hypothetical protein [Clostridium baratii]
MDYNILIGGSAGQGMDTVSDFLEKALKINTWKIKRSSCYSG